MYDIIDATGWRTFPAGQAAGRLEKQTLVSPDDNVYLFKWPERIGEAWGEKLAAEVGALLGLPVAEVELGRRPHPRTGAILGTLSLHFRFDGTTARPERCEPGVVLLQEEIPGYRDFEHYSYQRVRRVIEPLGVLDDFHCMLVLDALVCNIARHDENWELLDRRRLAPIFDSGRGELAFLRPVQQARLVESDDDRSEHFGRSLPALRWEPEGEEHLYSPEHLGFLTGFRDAYPDDFAVAVRPFRGVDEERLDRIVDDLPGEFIAEECRRLARIMLRERLDAIRGLA